MRIAAITLTFCLGLAAGAAADAPKGKSPTKSGPASSKRASKSQMSEIRSIVHELERSSSKLNVLLTDFESLQKERPPKGQTKQLERWEAAFDRLLRSLRKTHAAVIETTKRLNAATNVKLPTSLDKEVADARNVSEPRRLAAEQVLKKHKPKPEKAGKRATKRSAESDADAHLLDDLGP